MHTDTPSGNQPPTTSSHRHAAVADRLAARVVALAKVPGLSFAVASSAGLHYAGATGYADVTAGRPCTPDDQFLWFSMTKIATATAAMRLHHAHTVDLDEPIRRHLPDYPRSRWGEPTLRQLLSHTAGLPNPLPVRWVRPVSQPEDRELVTRLITKHGAPRRAVGTRAAYSNIGYLVAGRVLENATGRSVQDLVRELVLDPLNMRRTGFSFQDAAPRAVGYVRVPSLATPALRALLPRGVVGPRVRGGYTAFEPFLVSGAAYGGLVGPATDAVRLAAAHLAPATEQALLTGWEVEEMQRIRHVGKPFDHGIGWFRRPADAGRDPGFVEHYGTGGGYRNAMRVYPALDLAMVAMANTTASWDFDQLFTGLSELDWSC